MPYIKKENRPALDMATVRNVGVIAVNSGELNYILSTILGAYVESHGADYQSVNDALGAVHGAAAEMYRRLVAPYEEIKIKENGDLPAYQDADARNFASAREAFLGRNR